LDGSHRLCLYRRSLGVGAGVGASDVTVATSVRCVKRPCGPDLGRVVAWMRAAVADT